MSNGRCSIAGCERPHESKGLCSAHYQRLRSHGDPLKVIPNKNRRGTFEERFWKFVNKTDTCWLWTGCLDRRGYGAFHGDKTSPFKAHRVSFELAHGRKPKLHVLHSCDNPPCVNPDHLREGTHAENMADIARRNSRLRQAEQDGQTPQV